MPRFRLSRRAEADLTGIVRYTLDQWGEKQAARYVDEFESVFELLAGNPFAGRACGDVHPDLRRIEHQQHVIFYRSKRGRIVVTRILHQRMLPLRGRIEEV